MTQIALFDYEQLDIDTRTMVQLRTEEIRVLVKRSAQDIIEIGQKLTEVKGRLGHGNFENWIKREFGWTNRTARHFIEVSEHFKSEIISDLPIGPTALYMLASPSTPEEAREEAVERAETGEKITVEKAKSIIAEHAIAQNPAAISFIAAEAPELLSEVRAGTLNILQAKQLAKMSEERRVAVQEKMKEMGTEKVTKAARVVMQEQKKDAPPLPTEKYRVIYADPPWSYGNTMPEGTTQPDDHYPLISTPEICALPIKELADKNAVLFLWTTSPHLPESLDVIKAWGFEYKTSFVWDKIRHNMGHYNSVRHEFLFVCVRGSCMPDVPKLFDSVQSIERTEHSVKPEEFRQIIDTIYPHGKRIELFARRTADGWDRWGNDVGQ